MNDDTLILYFYNDGLSGSERQTVANALATDTTLAERYRAFCAELGAFGDPQPEAPPPDMVQRWHDTVDRAAGMEVQLRPKPGVHSWSFLLGVAVTAALALGIGIGYFIADDEIATPVIEELVADDPAIIPDSSNPFLRGLQVHLRKSERGLSEMPGGVSTDRTMLIMNIIEQNRIFERAAERNDSASLARVLRAFELVLVQLAADDIAPKDAEALRAKLLFELNVMLTKLAQQPSDEPQSI